MLTGLRIAVPRIAEHAGPLVDALRAKGALVHDISLSALAPLPIAPLAQAVTQLANYQWVLLAAAVSAERLMEAAIAANTIALLSTKQLATAGAATLLAVQAHGWDATVHVDRAPFEALLDALATRNDIDGARILYPAVTGVRDPLPDGIRALGARVDTIAVCQHAQDKDGVRALRELLATQSVDLIAASTSNIVDALLDAVPPEQASRVRLACIGPITARAARTARFTVAIEANTPTTDGLVAAIVASRLRAR